MVEQEGVRGEPDFLGRLDVQLAAFHEEPFAVGAEQGFGLPDVQVGKMVRQRPL